MILCGPVAPEMKSFYSSIFYSIKRKRGVMYRHQNEIPELTDTHCDARRTVVTRPYDINCSLIIKSNGAHIIYTVQKHWQENCNTKLFKR